MDVLAGLLDGPRASGAFLLRSRLSSPWALRVQDEAPLTVVALVRGGAWVVLAGNRSGDSASDTDTDNADADAAIELAAGDVAILRGPDPYVFADAPDTRPQAVIHPGQRCTTPDGRELAALTDLGLRTWGNDLGGETELVTGTYESLGEVCRPLLDTLPALIVVRGGEWRSPLVPLLSEEAAKDQPGQEAVLDRLLDLLLISVLRTWFARPGVPAPGWYRAHQDPLIGAALRLLHDDPARAWTVAALAAEVHVSRAGLARRFTDVVGVSPMAYLAAWRLALAADMLCLPGETIGSVARKVGYGSAFALSTAFKRVYGISPRDHREQAASPAAPISPATWGARAQPPARG